MPWWGVVIVVFVSAFMGFLFAAVLCAASKADQRPPVPPRQDDR